MAEAKAKKVILNIGHGGVTHDPGACANDIQEHYWNRGFVNNILVKKLEEKGIPYEIVNQHVYSTLYNRINLRSNPGDIVLSFHLNAADPEVAEGPEMLYYEKSKNSKRLATLLQTNIVSALGLEKDKRGIKPKKPTDRGGSLLYRTSCPCVILEPAFVTTLKDITRLTDKQEEYANAVIKSVEEYFAG